MNSQTGGGQAMSGRKKRKKSLGFFSTLGNFVGNIFGLREENSTLRPLTKGEWQRTTIERLGELYQVCHLHLYLQFEKKIYLSIVFTSLISQKGLREYHVWPHAAAGAILTTFSYKYVIYR